MCIRDSCGPLWEKDEDGIITTYSYNTARQLVEVSRSEVTEDVYKRQATDKWFGVFCDFSICKGIIFFNL